jgi:hypothetical protein
VINQGSESERRREEVRRVRERERDGGSESLRSQELNKSKEVKE